MFLLILETGQYADEGLIKFTFHNVSINSLKDTIDQIAEGNLHSTMFLLIPLQRVTSGVWMMSFTFHNVSINSITTT